MLIEYLNQRGNQTVTEDQQLVVAIQLKNHIKKIFGNNEDYVEYTDSKKETPDASGELLPEDDPANKIDDNGRNLL